MYFQSGRDDNDNLLFNIYVYIYISGVKISALTQAINFFSLTKIFNAINTGAELGLATPLTTAVSVTFSLEKKWIYSVAECGNGTVLTARAVPVHPVACIISYQSAN